MTDDDLTNLEALERAATPGPWEAGSSLCCPDMGWVDGPAGKGVVCPQYEASKRTHTLDARDAEFIAAARTALPALLVEVRRLRGLFDAAGQGEHNVLALIDHYQANSMDADARLRAIRKLLEDNGCDCPCEHHWEDHDDDCERCLACGIGEAVGR